MTADAAGVRAAAGVAVSGDKDDIKDAPDDVDTDDAEEEEGGNKMALTILFRRSV